MDATKAAAVCELLASGLSLRAACRKLDGPDPSTMLRWLEESDVLAQQYAQARARGYQLLADEIIEISDDSSGDVIYSDSGPKLDAEFVARSRLKVESRKWMLSKMLPKLYGDKLDLNHAGTVSHFHKVERTVIDPKK